MIWAILKKDLKKKPMANVILFLFIILSVMFAAAGANNIVTVLNAQQKFNEQAKVTDIILAATEPFEINAFEETLDQSDRISSYTMDEGIILPKKAFETKNIEDVNLSTYIIVTTFENTANVIFGEDNQPIMQAKKGEIYVAGKMIECGMFERGETFELKLDNSSLKLNVAGTVKDAVYGSSSISFTRVFVCEEDYQKIVNDCSAIGIETKLFGINDVEYDEVIKIVSPLSNMMLFSLSRDDLKLLNYLSLAISGLLILSSACLIVVFMTILRYTVRFTLSQETKEIGVMKAIGIPNRQIEHLYLAKYLLMGIIGTIIGFMTSIPFGNVMLSTLSSYMVIESRNMWQMNAIVSILVLIAIVLFCLNCLKKQRTITPMSAFDNGSLKSFEGKISRFSLRKSKLKTSLFMPIKDVLTSKKQYLILGLACLTGLVLMLVVVDTTDTMSSKEVYSMFSIKPSDLIWDCQKEAEKMKDELDETNASLEKSSIIMDNTKQKLKQLGIDADVFTETMFMVTLKNGEYETSLYGNVGVGTDPADYDYLLGSAPINDNEIALTHVTARALNVEIGDRLTVIYGNLEKRVIVTAIYQSIINTGNGCRFVSADDFLQGSDIIWNYIQIDLDENLTTKEKNEQIQLIRDNFEGKVYLPSEYLDTVTGNLSVILTNVKMIFIPLMIAVVVFVTMLMEASFIDKEKGEIALMKALGFKNRDIVINHVIRNMIACVIAIVLAAVLHLPIAKMTSGIVFRSLGASEVRFTINKFNVYVFYPLVMLCTIILTTWLSTLTIKQINARDTASIE